MEWEQFECWEEYWSAVYQCPYFCNTETGELVWSLDISSRQSDKTAQREPTLPVSECLWEQCWEEYWSEIYQCPYYENTETGELAWHISEGACRQSAKMAKIKNFDNPGSTLISTDIPCTDTAAQKERSGLSFNAVLSCSEALIEVIGISLSVSSLAKLASVARVLAGILENVLPKMACHRIVLAYRRCHSTVAAAAQHSVAVAPDGSVCHYGDMLGNTGETAERRVRLGSPMSYTSIATVRSVVAVACGARHVLLLDMFGKILSFGFGDEGQLGHACQHSESSPRLVHIREDSCAFQIAAGFGHNLALMKCWSTNISENHHSAIYAWGLNTSGQLGVGCHVNVQAPAFVCGFQDSAKYEPFKARVNCGDFHSALVTGTGELYTWGCGRHGKLGHGDFECIRPRRVPFYSELCGMGRRESVYNVACGSTFVVVAQYSTFDKGCLCYMGELPGYPQSSTLAPIQGGVNSEIVSMSATDGFVACFKSGETFVCGQAGVLAERGHFCLRSMESLKNAKEIALGKEDFAVVRTCDAKLYWCSRDGSNLILEDIRYAQ